MDETAVCGVQSIGRLGVITRDRRNRPKSEACRRDHWQQVGRDSSEAGGDNVQMRELWDGSPVMAEEE